MKKRLHTANLSFEESKISNPNFMRVVKPLQVEQDLSVSVDGKLSNESIEGEQQNQDDQERPTIETRGLFPSISAPSNSLKQPEIAPVIAPVVKLN